MKRREFLSKIGIGIPAVAGGMLLGISDNVEAGPTRIRSVNSSPKKRQHTFVGEIGLSYPEDAGCRVKCQVSLSDACFEELFQRLKAAKRLHKRSEVREVVQHALKHEASQNIRYMLLVADSNPNHTTFNNDWPYWKRFADIQEKKRIHKKQAEIMNPCYPDRFYYQLEKAREVGKDFKWS